MKFVNWSITRSVRLRVVWILLVALVLAENMSHQFCQINDAVSKTTDSFDTIDNTKDLIQHSIDLDIRIGNEIAPNMIAKKLASNFRILLRRRVIYLNTAYQTALKICKHMIV